MRNFSWPIHLAPRLARGESIIAGAVLGVAAIVVGVVAFSGWWSENVRAENDRTDRRTQVRLLSELLTQSTERLLSAGDLSGARRLLGECSRSYNLSECSLVLPDGKVLADANPGRINQPKWPTPWPSAPIDEQLKPSADEASPTAVSLLRVPGRGSAILRMTAKPSTPATFWTAQGGIALSGACALALIALIHRRLRTKLLTLTLIRDALRAMSAGERDTDLLSLNDAMGGEAAEWNKLLRENRELHAQATADRARAAVGSRRGGRSELDGVVESLSTGVVVLDASMRISAANGAAAALLGVDRPSLAGVGLTTLIDHPDLAAVVATIVAGAGQRQTLEVDRTKHGGGVLRVNVRPMRREDAGMVLLTIEDVTQQRLADAARNSFVAQATHELRAPLTNMRLCLETAMDADAEPAELAGHLNVLNVETRRLERLVGEMLSVAEIEAGSLRLRTDDVRLDKMFEELRADYMNQAAEKKVTFSVELPPKLPVLTGDRDKLAAALHNLVGNAMKYTPPGGRVTVAAREEGKQLVVDVTDTGIGIAEADRSQIFQKFFRANDPRVAKITGTGLGLALAKEMARLHGGDLTFTSEFNRGSTFTITIPVTARAA
jgi:PAS domain S-box-containing protein